MPIGFLNEAKQRVAFLIGRGQGRAERAFERRKGGDQVASMVACAHWRLQTAQAHGRFENSFASGLHGLVVNDRPAARNCARQQEARELDQAAAQEVMQRLGLAHITRERVGWTQARFPPWLGGNVRLVCVAPPLDA